MKRLLVNSLDTTNVRVALVESGRLVEYHFEESGDRRLHGNVYVGRVVNVEPAIQAAFIDIGENRSAFIHISDLHPAYADARGVPSPAILDNREAGRGPDGKRLLIQDVLHRGQSILVQVTKEAIGHKGPSVTSYLSIPGRYLVLMVGMSRAGISKKITDEEQRDQLRDICSNLALDENVGVIVRTAGEGRTRKEIESDFDYVQQSWRDVVRKSHIEKPPSLLYEESDLVIRSVRDLFAEDVTSIVVDSSAVKERVVSFIERTAPSRGSAVELYSGDEPLFHRYDIEQQIESIYDRKVPLPSGGSLVIDETEALVAVDVNSGKSRGQDDLEETAILINSEAAVEIARQLRLRDLGGVIVCDFIDMLEAANRRQVETVLRDELRKDRSKNWIARMSRFGLIEMTRQRLRPSKDKVGRSPCPTCAGRGTIRSPHIVAAALFRELRSGLMAPGVSGAEVWAGTHLLEYLVNEGRQEVIDIEDEGDKRVSIRLDHDLASDAYDLRIS